MRAADGRTVTATAGTNGAFSARVAAGSYTVTGRSPQFIVNGTEGTCTAEAGSGPDAVQVLPDKTVSVTVVCPTK